jgi:hypothetical protein
MHPIACRDGITETTRSESCQKTFSYRKKQFGDKSETKMLENFKLKERGEALDRAEEARVEAFLWVLYARSVFNILR